MLLQVNTDLTSQGWPAKYVFYLFPLLLYTIQPSLSIVDEAYLLPASRTSTYDQDRSSL